jgi:hypothetical protein
MGESDVGELADQTLTNEECFHLVKSYAGNPTDLQYEESLNYSQILEIVSFHPLIMGIDLNIIEQSYVASLDIFEYCEYLDLKTSINLPKSQCVLNKIHCAICFDNICNGCYMNTLKCNHSFHPKCIERWIQETPSCPLCKSKI